MSNKVGEAPQTPSKLGICIAEFLGTALLLFLGCMGCITEYEGMKVPHYMPAITFGLTVMLVIQIFGHISGAHLNPAVTLAAVLLGYMEAATAPVYLIGQFTGAVFGFGLLKVLVPYEYTSTEVFDVVTNTTSKRIGVCSTTLHPNVGPIQKPTLQEDLFSWFWTYFNFFVNEIVVGFAVEEAACWKGLTLEIIVTAILILTCCAIWDKRNSTNQDSTPLRFGFIIACIALVAGPFSGASMNTARSFAPTLFNSDWSNHWIYWVGPNVGAVIAVYFYKSMYGIETAPISKKDDRNEVELEKINSGE